MGLSMSASERQQLQRQLSPKKSPTPQKMIVAVTDYDYDEDKAESGITNKNTTDLYKYEREHSLTIQDKSFIKKSAARESDVSTSRIAKSVNKRRI